MRVTHVAGALVTLSLIGSASALAAAAGPSGNRQGIAVARAKHRAYAKIGAERVTETGFVSMYAVQGRRSQFFWLWGTGRVPTGWSRATEHVVVALRMNRVVWWRDDLTPPPCTGPGICARIPVELVVDRAGAYFAFGSAAGHTCFQTLYGTVPVRIGGAWDVLGGRYGAPVRHGRTIVLVRHFAWDAHRGAVSWENVSATSFLDLGGKVKVAAGGPDGPAFTVRYTDTQSSKLPRAPVVNRCG